jgi:hypothetical protein
MKTFDQLLDVLITGTGGDNGFPQNDTHGFVHLMYQWLFGGLTNAQIIEALNLDNTDPELATVKTHLDTLTKSDIIALESSLFLARLENHGELSITGISYDKARLRTLFGLS